LKHSLITAFEQHPTEGCERPLRLSLLRLTLLLAVTLAVLGGFLLAAPHGYAAADSRAAGTADSGYRDFSFGSSPAAPTAKDQQSKLWFNDGLWWGSLFNSSTLKFHIYKLNAATQVWSDTGTVIDDRDLSRSDAFSDGARLYVVTHGLSATRSADSIRLMRFTYNSSTKTYSTDAGFPVTLNTGGTQAATIDKDTTGRLWVAYTQTSKVYITHSTTSDNTWGTPYILPVDDTTNLLDQDEAAVVSFNGKIGVMWGNQNVTEWAYYFATHVDGAADTAWTRTTAHQGSEESDNHLNVKSLDGDPAGQVFAAVKTSLNAGDAPLYYLLILRNDGTWTKQTFGTVADNHTRAQVALDPVNRRLYMFGTSPCCSGGSIYYKDTSLDSPSFASGMGTPLIQNATDTNINNPSTTKQPLTSDTELVVEAADATSNFYVHARLDIGPDVTPPDTTINSGPSDTVGTADATFTFSATEGGSTFACRLDGAAFGSCTSPEAYTGLADGSHTFEVRAVDPVGNVDPSPASRTWAVDTSTQVMTFPAVADAFVEQARPTMNFGTSGVLQADDSPVLETFIRFAPSGLTGAVVEAKLRLFVSNGTGNGPALYRSDTAWSETAVSWDTRPATVGGVIEDKGAIAVGTWAEYDVKHVVTGNGSYSFRVDPTSTDGVDFHSRESANANKPQLVLTVDTDTIEPDTTIDSGPSGPVTSTSATFTFSSNESGASFRCSLDGAAYASCTSPRLYSGLAQGPHTFGVKAVDLAGNEDLTPATRGWSIDSSAPAAPVITSPLDNSTSSTGSIAASGTAEPGTSVQILDGATLAGTTTADGAGIWSATFTLADGSHTFTATATDAAGNTSPVSNARTVTVDSAEPETTIDSGPSGTTSSPSATFTFSASDTGATFQCKLDGAFTACTSPKEYTALEDGPHSFEVRATDAAGNSDPTPAGRTWTVDLFSPAAPVIASPANGSTTGASFTVSGTAEPGATVELFDGAVSARTTPAGGTGSWSTALSGVTEGSHTYTAKATDAVGHTSAASNAVTVTVDTGPPETTIDSGPSGTESSGSATFTFSSSETGSFECSLDGAAFAACTSPESYSSLGEGSHTFAVRATDAVGNVDPSPANRPWSVDANVPTVTAVVPVEGATNVLVNANVTATFSEAMDASSITATTFTLAVTPGGVGVAAGVTYDPVTHRATLDPATPLAPATSYTATVEGETDGVKDLQGSGLAADKIWSFTTEAVPDTTPPDTTIGDGPTGLTASSSATFTFSSSETGSTFECKLDAASFSTCTSPHTLDGLSEGSHTFRVRATDAAGNDDPSPAERTWTIDTVAPAAPAITSPADNSANGTGNVTVSGSAENSSTVELFDGGTSKGTTIASGSGSWSVSLTGVGDGSHLYTAKATDAAGNTSAVSNARTVIVDTAAPETTIDSGPTGPTASAAATFAFSSSETGSTFECKLDGGSFSTCTSPRTYTGLSETAHTFSVRATDAGGLTDDSLASRSWTVDVTAPAAPTITAPPDNSTSTSRTIALSGTAEANSTVEVFDGPASQGTTTADGAGSWSMTLNGVGDGSHTYAAKASDAAGNTSPSSGSRTVTVDATAPETTIDSGPSGTTTSTSATFTFSSNEAGANFACSLDGATFAGCASPQSYSSLAEGSHTFAVRATDALGNVDASQASRMWTIDFALFSDGFESGDFSAWTTLLTGGDGTAIVQGTTVKSGGFAAQLAETATAGSFAYARRTLAAPRTELRVKGDFQIQLEGASGGNVPILRLFDAAGVRLVSLARQNADRDKIRISHGSVGVTTTSRLTLNTWGHFELHVLVAGTASTVEVFLDGTLVYQTTTADLGTNGVSMIQIGNETKTQAFRLVADNIVVLP